MTLSVCARFDLDTLEKWVTEKFGPVENKNVVVPDLSKPESFPPEHLGKMIKYLPVEDKDELWLMWVLPHFGKEHTTQPLDYFSSLIGHEGENSLLSYLKEQDLALSLHSSPEHHIGAFSTFEVEITLSAKGLANHEDVIEAVFAYIRMLEREGPQ